MSGGHEGRGDGDGKAELGTIFGAMWDMVVQFNRLEDPKDRLEAIKEGR